MADGDLSVTALYTSGVWSWAGFSGAELYRSDDSDRVFAVTNAVLWLVSWFKAGPSLRHSLAQRHAMIDHLAHGEHVVELASGLSRRGAAFSERGVDYVEVDLPAVIARKEGLLGATAAGQAVLERANLRRIAADVRELDLPTMLKEGSCVVAEGLLMYFEADEQRALWNRIATALPSGRFVFDLVPVIEQPSQGWIGRALAWCMRRFTGGADFVRDARTREDVRAELLEAGFATVRMVEPKDLPEAHLPYLEQNTQILVFVCER